MNLNALAADLAKRVDDLARDNVVNRETVILGLLENEAWRWVRRLGIDCPSSPQPSQVALPTVEDVQKIYAQHKLPRLQLERPLCIFDIESTGTDVATDRILSLAVLKITPPDLFDAEWHETRKQWLVNPGGNIPADSTRIHGLTNEMVLDAPCFQDVAAEVHAFLAGADLCGFNAVNFDLPILWEELLRAGIEWDVDNIKLVDASQIFRQKCPRNLTAAVKKYCGREHGKAHEAMADVEATWAVLNGQRGRYEDLRDLTVAGLAEFSAMDEYEGQPAKRLDLSGLIIQDADGVARYTLKKVRGVAVADDPGFGQWMLRNTFPEHTKRVLEKLLAEL